MYGWKKVGVVGSVLGNLMVFTFFLIKMHCILCEQHYPQHLAFKSNVCLPKPPYTTANI